MPKVDLTLEKNKLFNPKKRTPWESLEKYTNELVLKLKTVYNLNRNILDLSSKPLI